MANSDKLTQAFVDGLGISASRVEDDLEYDTIEEWDSVAHMELIMEIEDQFDIMIETDDVIDMSSVGKAKEILTDYGIDFE